MECEYSDMNVCSCVLNRSTACTGAFVVALYCDWHCVIRPASTIDKMCKHLTYQHNHKLSHCYLHKVLSLMSKYITLIVIWPYACNSLMFYTSICCSYRLDNTLYQYLFSTKINLYHVMCGCACACACACTRNQMA